MWFSKAFKRKRCFHAYGCTNLQKTYSNLRKAGQDNYCKILTLNIMCSTVCLHCNLYSSLHPSLFPFRCGFRTDGQRNVGWSSSVPSGPGAMLFSEAQGGWGRWAADSTNLISLALGDTVTMEVWEKNIHFSSPFINTTSCPSYTAQKHIF